MRAAATADASAPSSDAWTIERVNLAPGGARADASSSRPAISADGRHVAFASYATNLLDGATPSPANGNLFVRDLATGTNEMVNVMSDGSRLSSPDQPVLSADGAVAAFQAGDSPTPKVFRRVRAGSTTDSWTSAATESPSVGGNGSRVAYLVPDPDPNDGVRQSAIEVFDATAPPGALNPRRIAEFDGWLNAPSISADGNHVVYVATGDSGYELRVQDITNLAAQPLPAADVLSQRNEDMWLKRPDISRDGRFVVYVPGSQYLQTVQVFDRQSRSETTVPGLPSLADAVVDDVAISDDGQTVAVVVRDLNQKGRLWVVRWADGRAEDVADAEGRTNGMSVDISADGNAVVFLDRGTGSTVDVFVAHGDALPVWPKDATLRATEVGVSFVELAWDAATDDVGVAAYEVTRDGAAAGETAGGTRSIVVSGLESNNTYGFAVTARDGIGQRTAGPAVSVTTASDSGEGARLIAQAHTGGRVSLAWDAASGGGIEGYRVMRATGERTLQRIADVGGETTSYTDTGLDAETSYHYEVRDLRSGVVEPYTRSVRTTTPALLLSSADWTGAPDLGDRLTITVVGEESRRGFAEIGYRTWFAEDGTKLGEPRSVTTTIEATQDPPGTYRAVFPLAEGVAEVSAIRAGIADGAAHTAARDLARLPVAVRGALTVEVDAPAGSIPNGRIVVGSASGAVGQQWISGGGSYRMLLGPDPSYVGRVVDMQGATLAERSVAVQAGLSTSLALQPVLPASLSVRVVAADGGPLEGVWVALSDVETGHLIAIYASGRDGYVPAIGSVAGKRIGVRVRSFPQGSQMLAAEPREIVLAAGANSHTVTFSEMARGVLAGTVSGMGSGGLQGVDVAVSQRVDERDWTFSGRTDQEGRYSILVLAGTATATFSDNRSTPHRVEGITVAPDSTTTQDVRLPLPSRYEVVVNLYTRQGEGLWEGPLPIDWRVRGHFYMEVRVWEGQRLVTSFGPEWASGIIDALPGQRIEACADGRDASMTRECVSAELGEDSRVVLDLHLSSVGSVTGSIVRSDGLPPPEGWLGRIRILDASGRLVLESPRPDGWAFDLRLPGRGDYVLMVEAGPSASSLTYTARVPVDGVGNRPVALGNVVVGSSPWDATITATRRQIEPGGLADLRLAVRSDSVGAVQDAVLRIDVPSGGAVVPASVMVNGAPVSGQVLDGGFEVPLGGGQAAIGWVVRYQIRLGDAAPGTAFPLGAQLRWNTAGGGSSRDRVGARSVTVLGGSIGMTLVWVVGVTLDAPPAASTASIWVSGKAPAGSVVRVLEGPMFLGEATASPGGSWRLQVTLPDHGDAFEHRLQAQATVGSESWLSPDRWVRFDSRYPVLEQITVRQPGRAVSFDPAVGVARFPYVLYISQPVDVQMRFGGRGEVASARARIGGTEADAARNPDGSFTAEVPPGWWNLGAIFVGYDSYPEPIRRSASMQKPTEAEVRDRLPAAVRDFTDVATEYSEDTSTGAKNGTVSAKLPSLGPDATMRTTMTVERGLTYQPTAADLATERRTGLPFYGLRREQRRTSDGLTVSISGYVPNEFLDGSSGSSRRTPTKGRGGVRPAFVGVARVGFQTAFNVVTNLDSGLGSVTAGGKYELLNRALDLAVDNCSAGIANSHREWLEALSVMALASDGLQAGLTVAGLVLAPATFGLGTVALWGVTWVAGKYIDNEINEAIEAEMASISSQCTRAPRDPRRDWLVADPAWIYDPSGYVFEAVESNRLAGITATLLSGGNGESAGDWDIWNADWFGQTNPLTTDAGGRYGWDVPEGWWKVAYTAPGYEPASSRELRVLPPHFDVNVGLVSLAAPTVGQMRAVSGPSSAVDVTFDKYMKLSVASGSLIRVASADARAISGTLEAVGAEASPSGESLARVFRFTPSSPFRTGEEVTVTVDALATSYADRPMLEAVTRTVRVGDGIAPQTALSHSGVVTSPLTATFDEAVVGVTSANLVLQVTGSAGAIPGSLSCWDVASAEVSCATGAVRRAALAPSAPLVPGQWYTAVVNPEGASPISDAAGNPMARASQDFRASVSEQETSPAAAYAWRQVSSRAAAGGSYVTDHRVGAGATFAFAGTSISWRTLVGPDQGKSRILVDGRSKGVISNYAPRPGSATRSFSKLGSGDHRITIVVAGKDARARDSLVAIDAFRVGGRTIATPSLRYAWGQATASRRGYALSDLAGSAVSFTFRGTSISWVARTGPDQGQAKVFIDGRLRSVGRSKVVDNYAARPGFAARSVGGLTDTLHTIRILVLGSKRTAARGRLIGVDRFLIG